MVRLHKKTILEALGRNPIHPFPARMAPGIALAALGGQKAALRVLDPMAGSGTVLAVARAKGHRAIGIDLDPMAVLLARVWTRTTDATRVKAKAVEVLARAKCAFRELRAGQAYPVASNAETREFIRYWFDDYARRQLATLAAAIRRVRDGDTREVLWCAFSRLIITKSAGASRAKDLAHSRPHRSFNRAPVKPFRRFLSAVSIVVANTPQRGSGNVGPVAVARRGDARRLAIKKSSIDLVLTSPPYRNGIDYLRCSKFSLVWMGYNVDELREIRSASIGTEASSDEALKARWVRDVTKGLNINPPLATRAHDLFARYVWDMGKALAEASRVLRPGGRAVYVVGDSMCRGTFIPNSSVILAVGKRHGLRVLSRRSRALPANRRYLPPPKRRPSKAAMDVRLRREVIITFRKPRSRAKKPQRVA